MDRSAAEDWIRAYVKPISAIETAHERPWSTVLRVRRSTATRSSGCAPSPRFDELAAHGIPETIQHDDLHMANLYAQGGRLRVLDWGDSSISHPFASLVVTFRFLEEINKLSPVDPWFARLRDAYLEPWGRNLTAVFDLALRVGMVADAIAWTRQRDHLPEEARPEFDTWFRVVLRRALAQTVD